MYWAKLEEATFYGAVWLVAFLVAVFRNIGSDRRKSWRVTVGSSGMAGFLGFLCVALLVGRTSGGPTGHWYYLGLAALIGFAGPYQTIIVERILKKTLNIELPRDEDETENEPQDKRT